MRRSLTKTNSVIRYSTTKRLLLPNTCCSRIISCNHYSSNASAAAESINKLYKPQLTEDPTTHPKATPFHLKRLLESPKPKLSQSEEPEWYERVAKWSQQIGFDPNDDLTLLQRALTHPSFTHTTLKGGTNSALEFYGDRILGFVLVDHFMRMNKYTSSSLSSLCKNYENNDHLYEVGKNLGIGDLVRGNLEHYNVTSTPAPALSTEANIDWSYRKGVISSAVEAIIAAIYMAKGDKVCADFIFKHVLPPDEEAYLHQAKVKNPRLTLSEYLETKGGGFPVYKILDEAGRMSNRSLFVVGVYSDGKMLGSGKDRSVRGAEVKASQAALDALKVIVK